MVAKFRLYLIAILATLQLLSGVGAPRADGSPRVLTMAGVADFYLPDLVGALEKELDARIVFETFQDTQSTIQSIVESRIRPDIIYVEALFRHDARLEKIGRSISASDVPNLRKIRSQLVEKSTAMASGMNEIPFQWYTLGVLWNKSAISLNVPRGVRFSIQDVIQPNVLHARSACKIGVVDHPQVIASMLEEATWSDWRVSPDDNGAHIAHSKSVWMNRLRTTLTRQPQERLLRNFVRGDICAVVTYSYYVNAMHRLHLYKDDFASNFGFAEFSGPTPLLVDRIIINKNSENLDLAFRAVDWLLADESQSRVAGYLGTWPVTSAVKYNDADIGFSQGREKRVDEKQSAGKSFFYAARSPGADMGADDRVRSFNSSWTSIPLGK